MGTEPPRAARAVQGCERLGGGETNSVRRAIGCLDERDPAEGSRPDERTQVMRRRTGEVGVDHERGAWSKRREGERHRCALAAAGIRHDGRSELLGELRARIVGSRDPGRADDDARGEHVSQHGQRQLDPRLLTHRR